MGSVSSYESPKGGYSVPAHSTPVSRPVVADEPISSINSLQNLVSEYLEITGKIEKMTSEIARLQQRKAVITQEMSKNPEFSRFAEMINAVEQGMGHTR